MNEPHIFSGIWDNHQRGPIGDFLKKKIHKDSTLSFVSAFFTIHAYSAMKESLNHINHLRFLFGEPKFIKSLDPEKTEKKHFRIEKDTLTLENQLKQRRVSMECAAWIKEKAVQTLLCGVLDWEHPTIEFELITSLVIKNENA